MGLLIASLGKRWDPDVISLWATKTAYHRLGDLNNKHFSQLQKLRSLISRCQRSRVQRGPSWLGDGNFLLYFPMLKESRKRRMALGSLHIRPKFSLPNAFTLGISTYEFGWVRNVQFIAHGLGHHIWFSSMKLYSCLEFFLPSRHTVDQKILHCLPTLK